MRVMDLLQAPQATHLQGDHFIHIQSQFPRLLEESSKAARAVVLLLVGGRAWQGR